jgi:cytochrome c oxidase assembly factor CtaG
MTSVPLAHVFGTSATPGDVPWLAPDPLTLLLIVLALALYLRARSILRDRGRTVPTSQIVSYCIGLACIFLGTQTGLHLVAETDLVSAHMLQHMLIADIPAPFLLFGIRAPLCFFYWPRPVLVTFARIGWLRSMWRVVKIPPVALSIWLVTLYAWHVPALYDAALTSEIAHAAQHLTFVAGGVLAWWPLMDPTAERLRSRAWKPMYVMAARMIGGILGIILIVAPAQLYAFYGDRAELWGMTAREDQQIAGAIMMFVDTIVVFAGFFWFMALLGSQEQRADEERRRELLAAR